MSKNEHTGAIQAVGFSHSLHKTLKEKGEAMSIEQRRANKGNYKYDAEQGRFIPLADWNAKYYKPVKRLPKPIIKNFEPYISPVSDKVISTPQQKIRDMKENGCREYEGFRDEKIEADKYKQYKDEKLWDNVGETMNQTLHDIEHGYLTPKEDQNPVKPAQAWTFND